MYKQDVYGNLLYDEFYFYKNLLSEDEKIIYNQIFENCVENNPYFEVNSPLVHANRIQDIYEAVMKDNPDLFWVGVENYYDYENKILVATRPSCICYYDNNGYIKSLELSYYYDCAENLDAFKDLFYDCADSVLEVAMELKNDVEKVKFIHDFLTTTIEYNYDSMMNQSAYSSISIGETVCAGYSKAFVYYMQRLGIPAAYLSGYTNSGGRHAWNFVKLDNQYYSMDVTWDDGIENPPYTYRYNYFNITDDEMHQTRYRETIPNMLPRSVGTVYSYPNYFGDKPGSDFSEISFSYPKKQLPFIYAYVN